MNEELKNNNEMVELVEEVDTYTPEEEFEESGGILKKVAVGVGALTVGALGTLAVKNRDKLKAWKEERTVKKLEKKGYEIFRPGEFDDFEEFEEIEDFEDEIPEEEK